jgi:hypothetical protein
MALLALPAGYGLLMGVFYHVLLITYCLFFFTAKAPSSAKGRQGFMGDKQYVAGVWAFGLQ